MSQLPRSPCRLASIPGAVIQLRLRPQADRAGDPDLGGHQQLFDGPQADFNHASMLDRRDPTRNSQVRRIAPPPVSGSARGSLLASVPEDSSRLSVCPGQRREDRTGAGSANLPRLAPRLGGPLRRTRSLPAAAAGSAWRVRASSGPPFPKRPGILRVRVLCWLSADWECSAGPWRWQGRCRGGKTVPRPNRDFVRGIT